MKVAINSLDHTENCKWFDIEDYWDAEFFELAITDWLEELSEEDKLPRSRWNVSVTEDIPSEFISDGGKHILPALWDYIDMTNGGADPGVLLAGLNVGLDLENVLEQYKGEHSSDVDFAKEMFPVDLGDLEVYFDYEHYASDKMTNYVSYDNHYFSL